MNYFIFASYKWERSTKKDYLEQVKNYSVIKTNKLKLTDMNIYVGNLDYKVNEDDLKGIFEEFGTVSSAKIIIDKYNGRSKGFGFIEMDNETEAKKAIDELHGATLENREMVVNEAKPKRTDYNR